MTDVLVAVAVLVAWDVAITVAWCRRRRDLARATRLIAAVQSTNNQLIELAAGQADGRVELCQTIRDLVAVHGELVPAAAVVACIGGAFEPPTPTERPTQ